jgi:6-phosphogluconolactonase
MKNLIKSVLQMAALLVGGFLMNSCGPASPENPIRFYVGSSDTSLVNPIFLCEYDPIKEQFSVIDSFAGASGSSYLVLSPGRNFLYAIDKQMAESDTGSMKVTSFTRERGSGRLSYLNSQPSMGMGPCHVNIDREGTCIFAANYFGGDIAVFPLDDQGRILPASSEMHGAGSGPVADRQEGSHPHFVTLDPPEKYLLSTDLGADRVMVFAFDRAQYKLEPNPGQPFFSLKPGSGPRHLVFHPEGRSLYISNELNATVTACSYDPAHGILAELNTVSTVRDDYTGTKFPAAVRISPDGRYVYASTRGDISSIAVFRVEADGSVSRVQVMEGVPDWPRDFNIDPSGRWLIAAGERAHRIELYHRDSNTGKLTKSGIICDLPSPGCVLFVTE